MTLRLFSTLLIFAVAVFSCAPKDAKLVRPGEAGKSAVQSADETLKLSFIAFDKQVEALFLVKALLNEDYAAANGVEVVTTARDNLKVQKTLTIKNQVKENDDFKQTTTAILKADLEFDGSVLVAAKIYNVFDQQSVSKSESKKQKIEIEVNSVKKVISITKVDLNYVIDLHSIDELATANSISGQKYTDISKISSSMTFMWDGNENSLGAMTPISKLNLHHLKLAQAKSEVALNSIESKLIIQLAGPCWQLNGELQVETAKTVGTSKSDKFTFQFEDSVVKVAGKKINSPTVECASRPPVDLRKLQ